MCVSNCGGCTFQLVRPHTRVLKVSLERLGDHYRVRQTHGAKERLRSSIWRARLQRKTENYNKEE